MTKSRKKQNPKINKILLGVFSILIIGLVFLVVASIIYLSPVDKKNNKNIVFKVEQGWGKNIIADKLEEEGLIRNALIFKIYIKFNINKELYAGTYNLSKSMSVDEIIDVLNSNNSLENESISVTFIEGKRLTDYVKKISETFNYPEEEILKKLNDPEFLDRLIKNYWFITEDIKNEKLYYPLEGYLFADTYVLKKNSSIEEIIDTMINNMSKKLENYKEEIEISSLNIHQILTLASIVELEGASSDDRAGVAGVFYNRMNANMSLGSDVTTYYGVKKDFSHDLSMSNLRNCNPYNTSASSTCANEMQGKLPAGPIASPSYASITASIEPKKHDYYYFVADKNKKTYFSKTNSEHEATVSKLKKEGLWYQY